MRIWYDRSDASPWQLIAQADTSKADTIEIKPGPGRADFIAKAKLILTAPVAGATALQHPDRPAMLVFNHPIAKADTALIAWVEDTIREPVQPLWSPDSAQLRALNASWPWKEALLYEMLALPGAFTDVYGLTNADTIVAKWRIEQRKNFATLNITLENMDSNEEYVLILLNSGRAEVLSRRVPGDSDGKLTLGSLQPGQYSLRVVLDRNRNGRWDSGVYDTALQPEEVFHFPLEQLRGNWELDTKVSLKPKE